MRRVLLPTLVSLALVSGLPATVATAEAPCHLTPPGVRIADLGDGDGFADTHETLEVEITAQAICNGTTPGDGHATTLCDGRDPSVEPITQSVFARAVDPVPNVRARG